MINLFKQYIWPHNNEQPFNFIHYNNNEVFLNCIVSLINADMITSLSALEENILYQKLSLDDKNKVSNQMEIQLQIQIKKKYNHIIQSLSLQNTKTHIKQGGIGNCFLLTILEYIANSEPKKLEKMFCVDKNNNVKVTFDNLSYYTKKIIDHNNASLRINNECIVIESKDRDDGRCDISFILNQHQIDLIENEFKQSSSLIISIFTHIIPYFFGMNKSLSFNTGLTNISEYDFTYPDINTINSIHRYEEGRDDILFTEFEVCDIFKLKYTIINKSHRHKCFYKNLQQFFQYSYSVLIYVGYDSTLNNKKPNHSSRIINYDQEGITVVNPWNTAEPMKIQYTLLTDAEFYIIENQ